MLESRDSSGLTPLMILASSIVGTRTLGRKLDSTGIQALLSLGANKNATDLDGHTPYGLCLHSKRNSDDFYACFGLDSIDESRSLDDGYEELIQLLYR